MKYPKINFINYILDSEKIFCSTIPIILSYKLKLSLININFLIDQKNAANLQRNSNSIYIYMYQKLKCSILKIKKKTIPLYYNIKRRTIYRTFNIKDVIQTKKYEIYLP